MSDDDKKLEDDDASLVELAEEDAATAHGEDEPEPEEDDEEGEEGEDGESEEEPEDEETRLRDELADTKDRLLRAMAETENLRRRAVREREDAGKYAISSFARDMLSVIDNLRRALDSLPDEHRQDEALSGLISGVEMTERELIVAFERNGIKRIEPLGEKFDHNFHQAMFYAEGSDQPEGTVVKVVQAGYVIADRLLRPAIVGVAKTANKTKDEDIPHLDTEA